MKGYFISVAICCLVWMLNSIVTFLLELAGIKGAIGTIITIFLFALLLNRVADRPM